jgi:membrane peptidoglycan carboxypeptidase
MGLKEVIKNHKKKIIAASLGIAALYGEYNNGILSRTTGFLLSKSGDITHSQQIGQYWQGINDHEKFVSITQNETPENITNDGSLPDTDLFNKWPLQKNNEIKILATDGTPIFTRNSTFEYLKYDEIPKSVLSTILAREDRDYFKNHGVNWKGKFRAAYDNIFRGKKSGGSGITEQVAKMTFTKAGEISPPRKGLEGLAHKLFVELPYAMELDYSIGKEKVLEFYVNNAYFGDGSYGIEAASNGYFGKKIQKLNLCESLFLATLLRNPGINPKENSEYHMKSYHAFLDSLNEDKIITEEEHLKCINPNAIKLKKDKKDKTKIAYASALNALTLELNERGIDLDKYLFKYSNPAFGFTIKTTLDREIANLLQRSVNIIPNKNKAEANGVVLDNDANIIAIVGRRNYDFGDLNLVLQEPMQMASTIKPFIFGTCYETKICDPYEMIVDNKEDLIDPPNNWDEKYGRNMTLTEALANSNNIVTRKVYDRLPFYDLLSTLESSGFNINEYRRNGSLEFNKNALGTSLATPLEVAAAYNIFNRRGLTEELTGEYIKPTIIKYIEVDEQRFRKERSAEKVFSTNTLLGIRYSLEDVASDIIDDELVSDAFFKTGTSKNTIYAWVAGGFSLDKAHYTLVLNAKGENGKSISANLYSTQILGPAAAKFVEGVSTKYFARDNKILAMQH